MKKITYLIISIIFLNFINACAGYKPIYIQNLQFKIADHSIKANKKLGRQIYSKLYNLSKSNKNNTEIQSITIIIASTKNKNATVKDSAGKILEYKIILSTEVYIKDFKNGDEILNETFVSSATYKTQDQQSETVNLENKSIDNLINNIYQKLLIKLSQYI